MSCMAILGRPSQADDERAAAWRNWLQRQNSLAIAAFVLGALSLTHGGTLILDGVAGVVLGVVALVQLKKLRRAPEEVVVPEVGEPPTSPETLLYEVMPSIVPKDKGRGLAWGGIVLGALSLVIGAYLYSLRPAAAVTGPTTWGATTRAAALPR